MVDVKNNDISWHKFMSTILGVLHGFSRGGLMVAMLRLPRIWLSHIIPLYLILVAIAQDKI